MAKDYNQINHSTERAIVCESCIEAFGDLGGGKLQAEWAYFDAQPNGYIISHTWDNMSSHECDGASDPYVCVCYKCVLDDLELE